MRSWLTLSLQPGGSGYPATMYPHDDPTDVAALALDQLVGEPHLPIRTEGSVFPSEEGKAQEYLTVPADSRTLMSKLISYE